jgi:membrane protein required for colicin V production
MMDNLPINGLDLAVGIILLISALLAFMRGFVHEVLSIAAWAGAVLAAIQGMPFARPFARKIIPVDWAADSAAAVTIFLVVLLILSILTNAVARSIQKSALNNLDRSLGFVFGLARALVILAVGLIITDWLTNKRPTWLARAKTLPILEMTAEAVKSLVPTSFMAAEDVAKEGAARMNKTINTVIDAKDVFDKKDTLDKLTAPVPQGAAAKEAAKPEGGYQDRDRRTLDSLIDRTDAETPPPSSGATP